MSADLQRTNNGRRLFVSRSVRHRRRFRGGLTLVELLLVLVIMVIAAALVVPRLFNSQQRQTLRSAADQLNAVLLSTRQQSMVDGQQLFLLYEAGTPFFAVVPEPMDDTTRGEFEQVTSTLSQIASSYDPANEVAGSLRGTTGIRKLPMGTRFLAGDTGVAGPSDLTTIAADISGLPFVAFAPDGTTDDAILELVNDDFDRIAVQLRGLTGTSQVGELVAGRFAWRSGPTMMTPSFYKFQHALRPSQRRSGLSLLEVVLALVILAMSIVAIGQLMAIGGQQSVTAMQQSRGQLYAQSLLDSVAVGILPMQSTGWTGIESDIEWEYTLEIEDNTLQGLKAVTAIVRPVPQQSAPAGTSNNNATSPSTVSLRRWILDPTFVAKNKS